MKWNSKNVLLSCGADINAYVISFNQQTKKWKGSLVNIPGNGLRALTCCDWSKDGDRFAIGGGTGELYIGYFYQEKNQWDTCPVSIGKNTIATVKFHPTETNVLAATSIDENLTVLNIDIKNINKYISFKEGDAVGEA